VITDHGKPATASPNERCGGQMVGRMARAFSSETGTGSHEENASKQNPEPGFDSIKTE
jgi:hypothetical protein